MLFEFDDVYELNTKHDKFHFTKKINRPLVIETFTKLWKFELIDVEQTLFKICGNIPVVICICLNCTQIIKLDGADFSMTKSGEFICIDSEFVYMREKWLNLSTGGISRALIRYSFDFNGTLHFLEKFFLMKVGDTVDKHTFRRFKTHKTYVEILTSDYNIINYRSVHSTQNSRYSTDEL